MQMRLRQDAVPPIELREDCPPLLNDIVMKAMARAPENRYQTATELLDDLKQLKASLEAGAEGSLADNKGSVDSNVEESVGGDLESQEEKVFAKVTVKGGEEIEPKTSVDLKSVLDKYDEPKKRYSSFEEFVSSAKAKSDEIKSKELQEVSDQEMGVSVNQGALRSDRVRELSSHQSVAKKGGAKSIILWLFVLFIWLGLIFSVLKYYKPEMFGGKPRASSSPGFSWEKSRVINGS
jgi:serine/threonine protein kinase